MNYPTPLLKIISREGTGGIISPEFHDDIPNMVSIYNGFILTGVIGTRYPGLVSIRGGIKFAINSEDLDRRTSIDLPIIYPRIQTYYEGCGLEYGMNFNTKCFSKTFNSKLFTEADIQVFHFPGADENFHVETSLNFAFIHKKTEYSAGVKLIYGEYPFGTQWHLLPMFDIVWRWGK